jgi:hypothetical protein
MFNDDFLRTTPSDCACGQRLTKTGCKCAKICPPQPKPYKPGSDPAVYRAWVLKQVEQLLDSIDMVSLGCMPKSVVEERFRCQCKQLGYKCPICYEDSCLCGGRGCNSCEPQGRG